MNSYDTRNFEKVRENLILNLLKILLIMNNKIKNVSREWKIKKKMIIKIMNLKIIRNNIIN